MFRKLLLSFLFIGSLSAQPLATFNLPEYFSTTWGTQPIEFRYDGSCTSLPCTSNPGSGAKMLGPSGPEVFYEWVPSCSDTSAVYGCVAVQSPLPSGGNYTWTLTTGSPSASAPSNPVSISTVGNNYEMVNGITGTRLVTTAGNPNPYYFSPIQGLKLVSGTWTGAASGSPNKIYTESVGFTGNTGEPLQTPAYTATGFSSSITLNGALKSQITLNYTFNRPRYYFSTTTINASGTGHYTVVITMYAGSKSILIDEDTDMQMAWYLPLYNELGMNIVQHRAANSYSQQSVFDPVCGYTTALTVTGASNATPISVSTTGFPSPLNGQRVQIQNVTGNTAANGIYYAKVTSGSTFSLFSDVNLTVPITGSGVYGGGGTAKPAYMDPSNAHPVTDGYIDLTYTSDRAAGSQCSYGHAGISDTYTRMETAYPSNSHSGGWHVVMYNSGGISTDPVVGMYVGKLSRIVNVAATTSEPGVYTSNNHFVSSMKDGGIEVDTLMRGGSGVTAPINHRNWGIFVSTQADVLPIASHQPIEDEQNMFGGINLSSMYRYQLTFPDPIAGWKWAYMPDADMNQVVSWVRDGTSKCGSTSCYYNALVVGNQGDANGLALLNMWRGNSTAAVATALATSQTQANNLSNIIATGDNRFDATFSYYQLGLNVSSKVAPVLNAILVDSNSTTAQKTAAKTILAFFGSLTWDLDWFPFGWDRSTCADVWTSAMNCDPTGDGVGNANQVDQYFQYRSQLAGLIPTQPFLATIQTYAASYPAYDLAANFNITGAVAGSTHYQGAFTEPLLNNYLNYTKNGLLDMSSPIWPAYAQWEMSIQTPPEPRYGGSTNISLGPPLRKGYSNGDGNTEGDARPGILANALQTQNPSIAANLMWAWNANNSSTTITEDNQFMTTLTTIDPLVSASTPTLSSINIPGYHSVERFNFGTANETALFYINGGVYNSSGHRHADDGQVSIYALSSPMAIDWNANLYFPPTPGRWMHNSQVPDSEISGNNWYDDNLALNLDDIQYGGPTNTEFISVTASTCSLAHFTKTSDGTVWQRRVCTYNWDPAYPVIYVEDTFTGTSATLGKTLTWNMMASGAVTTPIGSVTPITRLTAACQGTPTALPSTSTPGTLVASLNPFNFTGINWAKHSAGGINWDLLVSSNGSNPQFTLGNWGHGCAATREIGEYKTANSASNFNESQHILRIHDNASTMVTVMLPYMKGATPSRTVTSQTCGTQIVMGSETACLNDSVSSWTNGTQSYLTSYDTSTQTQFGMTITGGSQEAMIVSATQITWTLSGANSGTRSFTPPSGGGWISTPALTPVSGVYSYNYTGGLQTAPVQFNFIVGNPIVPNAGVNSGKGVGAGPIP